MMKLLLVRHGDTGPDYRGRYIGTSDVPLWPDTVFQVKALSPLVMNHKPQLCYVSPMVRARQTADLLIKDNHPEICIDNDLREIDFGFWDGYSFDEITEKDPELVSQWAAGGKEFRFPGGESIEGFCQRVGKQADHYTSLQLDTLLLVTHGGVIRAMICHLLGLSFDKYLSFSVKPAALTVLESFEAGSAVLTGFNLTGSWIDG
jgi:alpha-ribazole phosphatase